VKSHGKHGGKVNWKWKDIEHGKEK
jgi:hypothetical protein